MMSAFCFTLVETSFILRREKLRAATRSQHRLVALAQTRSHLSIIEANNPGHPAGAVFGSG
jgi:hypothetical protein